MIYVIACYVVPCNKHHLALDYQKVGDSRWIMLKIRKKGMKLIMNKDYPSTDIIM